MKISSSEKFGQALRQRRKMLGYTQADISGISGLSISFISELENGKPTAELEKAIETALLLGLDIEIKERGL